MTQPIIWNAQEVNDANLQDSVGGPYSRLVDGNLSSNSGRQYTNLQDAWDAASPGDSIFVKAATYAGGLVVSSGAGNNKNGISVHGEVVHEYTGGEGGPTFGTWINVADCNDLDMSNLTVSAAGNDGMQFENIQRYRFSRLVADAADTDGIEVARLRRGIWLSCHSRDNAGRGFVMHDEMQRNTFLDCHAEGNTGHGWALGAFPASNSWCSQNTFLSCFGMNSAGSSAGWTVTVGTPASGAAGWQYTKFIACHASDNGGDGWAFTNIGSGNPRGMAVNACSAVANGSAGYRMTTAPASWPEFCFNANSAFSNTAGSYLGFPATLLPGYLGRGLTVPGTNT